MIFIFKIYCVTNLINNKKYIGITSRSIQLRFNEHCSHKKTLLYLAIKKYGKDNFKVELIEDNVPNDKIDEKERFYISFFNSLVPSGYNRSIGGIKNKKLNNITKRHLKEINLGINNPRCNKRIFQIDKNTSEIVNIFGSCREAARFLGNEQKNVSINRCLNGKQKTAYGYKWKYEDI